MPVAPTANQIRNKLCAGAFGEPLISNIYRGLVAEIIVGAALGPEWRFCSGDWRGWDFEHAEGCRLEVKQSAARQTCKSLPQGAVWKAMRPMAAWAVATTERFAEIASSLHSSQ